MFLVEKAKIKIIIKINVKLSISWEFFFRFKGPQANIINNVINNLK